MTLWSRELEQQGFFRETVGTVKLRNETQLQFSVVILMTSKAKFQEDRPFGVISVCRLFALFSSVESEMTPQKNSKHRQQN